MNNEEIDLLRYDLIIEYYKNKDITTRYRRITDNTVIDNEILDNLKDTLFITTLSKYNKLQKENKQLKENWNKLKSILIKQVDEWECVDDDLIHSQVNEDKTILLVMKELEKSDSNE